MITQNNEALVRSYIEEVFNNRNLAVIADFLAPDEVDHSLPPGMPTNITGTTQGISMFLKAFPDLRITIDESVAEGDKVTTPHGYSRGLLSSSDSPSAPVPEGSAPACTNNILSSIHVVADMRSVRTDVV